MSRLYMTGAEWQSITANSGYYAEVSSVSGTGVAIDTNTKRSGTASYKFTSSASASSFAGVQFNATNVFGFVRAYVYFTSFPSDTRGAILQLNNALDNATCGTIAITEAGKLRLYDGNIAGTQRGSDSAALSLNTWYGIELMQHHLGTPELEARYWQDGVGSPTVFASGDMTTTSNSARIYFGMIDWVTGCVMYMDDIAINSNAGSVNNTYPGEGKLALALPNAAGDNAADSGDYTCINEVPSTTTTTAGNIIELSTATSIGDYNVTDSASLGINSTSTIAAVSVLGRLRQKTSGTTNYILRIKSASGGTVSATAATGSTTTVITNYLSSTYGSLALKLIAEVDPTTNSAWTPTGTNSINNMQIGVATTDGSPTIQVCSLAAYIDYQPGTETTALKDLIGGIIPFAR